MAPLENTFTARMGELGHVLLWVSASRRQVSVKVNGRERIRTLFINTARCSGCDFEKTLEGKNSYSASRSAIKQAWRKAHAHLLPESDSVADRIIGAPDSGMSNLAYEEQQRKEQCG